LRAVAGSEATDPQQAGFPSARQIVCIKRRVLRDGRMSNETVHLISSLDPQKTCAADLKKIKRDYWGIESDFHSRLDETLDEDRSRVRSPKAAFVLGMFRRLALSFAIPWIAEKQKKRKRTSTRDFLDHLRAENARRAFDLTTSKSPTSWNN
jgi:hypothetical protein